MSTLEKTGNLPDRYTSFVGRTKDISELRALLRTRRLVTITGPGGSGKSRLATELGARVAGRFASGVWIAELHTAIDQADVYSAIASAMEVPEVPGSTIRSVLMRQLADSEILLILDNCEHLVAAVGEVASDLLGGAPGLTVLCTSREPLSTEAEQVWPLEGLQVPADLSSLDLKSVDSIELFSQRAQAIDPGFSLQPDSARSVGEICTRVDGLPLAIELSASQVGVFTPSDIARRLDDTLTFLRSTRRDLDTRHENLAAVIQWSYDLLSPTEATVLDRLSVFSGGFDLTMASKVAGYDLDTTVFEDTLRSLVSKSLVTRMPAVLSSRYRLLEMVRQFAQAQLSEKGMASEVADRHAEAYRQLAEDASPHLWQDDQVVWLERLEADHQNLRSALNRLLDHRRIDEAQRLAGSLARFWDLHGHYTEGLRLLRAAVESGEASSSGVTVLAYNSLATLALLNGEVELSMSACATAIEAARASEDLAGEAYALQYLGLCWIYAGDLTEAREVLDESVVAAEASGDQMAAGWSGIFFAAVELFGGDLEAGRMQYLKARRHLELAGEGEGQAWTYTAEAIDAWLSGDLLAAALALRRAMEFFGPLRAGWGISVAAVLVGRILLSLGDPAAAAQALLWSEALRRSIGAAHLPEIERWLSEGLEMSRSAVTAEEFSALSGDSDQVRPGDVPDEVAELVEQLVDLLGSDATVRHQGEREVVRLSREGDVWAISFRGKTERIRHVVGLTHLAALLYTPGREISAIELVSSGSAIGTSGNQRLLDDQAVEELKARIRDLEGEVTEAEAWADLERAAQARTELDQIAEYLSQSLGLESRPRLVKSDLERARVNVTKAIRSGIARITDSFEYLGRHLDASISTGRFCVYRPDPSSALFWVIEM